jgi:hypothetical protein
VVDVLQESRKSSDLLADEHDLDADGARKWRDHPAQYWLERTITTGLPARGGEATREGDTWRIRWADGSESATVCFDARTAADRPEIEWVTLEDPRAQALIADLPRFISGQPVPAVRIAGLPDSVKGVWSLWEISLAADDFSRRRFLSVFVNDEGRAFQPTAKRIWDVLLTEQVEQIETVATQDAHDWFRRSKSAAIAQGERVFSDLVTEHKTRIEEERGRALYAFEARDQAIGRVGLQTVRDYRRKRLQSEHEARMAQLHAAASYSPDLNALLVLRVGELAVGEK